MAQVETKMETKQGTMTATKEKERGHQRGPQIQLKRASEAIERDSGTSGTERASNAASRALEAAST